MFEENEVLTKQVEKLYDECKPLNRGDMISHETIEAATGVTRIDAQWNTIIEKWRRKMIQLRSVAIMSERKFGYKLCTIHEQINEFQFVQLRRAISSERKAIVALECLPLEDLTEHERIMQAVRMQHGRRNLAVLTNSMKEQVYFQKPESLPLLAPVS